MVREQPRRSAIACCVMPLWRQRFARCCRDSLAHASTMRGRRMSASKTAAHVVMVAMVWRVVLSYCSTAEPRSAALLSHSVTSAELICRERQGGILQPIARQTRSASAGNDYQNPSPRERRRWHRKPAGNRWIRVQCWSLGSVVSLQPIVAHYRPAVKPGADPQFPRAATVQPLPR